MKAYRPSRNAGDVFSRPHKFQVRTGRENKRRHRDDDDKITFVLVAIAVVVPIIGSIIFRVMEN